MQQRGSNMTFYAKRTHFILFLFFFLFSLEYIHIKLNYITNCTLILSLQTASDITQKEKKKKKTKGKEKILQHLIN